MKPRIFYTKPSITELEVRYATDAAANGWGDQCMPTSTGLKSLSGSTGSDTELKIDTE